MKISNQTPMALALSLLAVNTAQAAFDDAGTDYSTDAVARYAEDVTDQYLSTTNLLTCIVGNIRPDLPQHAATGRWSALINEQDCELLDSSDTGGATTFTNVLATSARASNDTPQELSTWMSMSNGNRYLASGSLSAGPATTPPFGAYRIDWFNAFMPGVDGGGPVAWSNTRQYGFTNISTVGSDTVLEFAEQQPDPGGTESIAGIAKFVGGSVNDVNFIARNAVAGGSDTIIAGRANATLMYRTGVNASDGSLVAGTAQCLKRNDVWQSAYTTNLYYKNDDPNNTYSAGQRLKRNAGFGVTYVDGSSNVQDGYIGQWGAWLADGGSFTPTDNTLNVTRRSDSADYTLTWAPGRFEQRTSVSSLLSDGDTFNAWVDLVDSGNAVTTEKLTLTWDDSGDHFDTESGSTSFTINSASGAAGSDTYYFYGNMESLDQRQHFNWNFETDSDAAVESQQHASVQASHSLMTATSTKLLCASTQCFDDTVTASDMPSYFGKQTPRATANPYYLTGLTNTPSGFKPASLYYDNDGNGLDSGDTLIAVNFIFSEDQIGAQTRTGADFDGNVVTVAGTVWPSIHQQFIVEPGAGDACAFDSSTNQYAGADCIQLQYNSGAFPFDRASFVTDSTGTAVSFDDTLFLSANWTQAQDPNTGKSYQYKLVNDDGENANHLSLCTDTNADGTYNGSNDSCTIDFTGSLNPRAYSLWFDSRLEGLPWENVTLGGDHEGWIRLRALRDGTTVTDSNSIEYVTKNVEIGEYLIPAASGACDTANLSFTNLSGAGLGLADLPNLVSDFTAPTILWANAPTPDATSCDVVQGEATCPE